MTHLRTDVHRVRDDASVRRLASLLRPYMGQLVLALLMLLCLAGVNMLLPLCIKLLIDDVFPTGRWPLLWLTLFSLVLCYLWRNVLYYYSKITAVQIGENVCFSLRNRLFERLQHMTLQYYKQTKPGQVSSRVMDDSFLIQTFIQDELPKLLQATFLFLGLVAVLYAVNWQLALAATIVLPLHLLVFRRFKGPIKTSSALAQETLAVVHGNLIEKFPGMEVIKGFTGEKRESEAFVRATNLTRVSQLRSKTYHVTQKIMGDLLVGAGTVALLGFGAYHVIEQSMAIGTFVVFFAWVGMLYPTVLQLMTGLAKLTRCTASIDRVFDMLDPGNVGETDGGKVREPIRGHIVFDGVGLAYHDGVPVLKDISFEVLPGQVCAITGPSGSGKSTLVNLVPRLIEPEIGRILIDGVNIEEIELCHLREHIGIAFQECFLFNSSILENIQYSSLGATMHEVVSVAKRTGAHDFIIKLPDGYATIVGESGMSLSRGEKQRIGLTRALLKNPRILILDEATVSLDIASAAQIIPAILDFMRGKTTLLVTHRPELLCHADLVVELQEGGIIRKGPKVPSELLLPELMKDAGADSAVADEEAGSSGVGGGTADTGSKDSKGFEGDGDGEAKGGRGRSGIWQSLNIWLAASALGLSGLVMQADRAFGEDEPAAAAPAPSSAPRGRFLAQPGLNELEVKELLEVVTTRVRAELGYRTADKQSAAELPAASKAIRGLVSLAKTENGATRLVQIGYRVYRSQPIHIWLFGITEGGAETSANPDLPAVETRLTEARQSGDARAGAAAVSELASRKIKLSYVGPARCLDMLRVFGFNVMEAGAPIDPKNVPVIVEMPPTAHIQMIPWKGQEEATFPATVTDPINELLVFYDPVRPEQYARVLEKVRRAIDVPARQIMIEAMVLEISDVGIKRLGVDWELESSGGNIESLRFGRVPAFATTTDQVPTLDVTASNVFGEFHVKLKTLVREGFAKVLSRPSVLTLDNRMAFIDVARRIPVVNSITNPNANTVTVSFKEVRAGITLKIRPRISADGEEVSMQVITVVTARVPNEDVVVRNNQGDEVARSPTISERRVHSIARIANNTPYIIGGLVAQDDTTDRDKVPVLGDLPLVGALFRSDRINKLRREVIIVITPFVLPENAVVARNLPKDDDAFDSFGNKLFRDAYRIRAEDVFDLGFLFDNRQLKLMQALADRIADDSPDLARIYPVNRFLRGGVPGEKILVYRQMYEVIKRRRIDEQMGLDKIIFFAPDSENQSGFRVKFLRQFLAEQLGLEAGKNPQRQRMFQEKLKGKALALTYTLQSNDVDPKDIFAQPVPALHVLRCSDRQEYSRLLWKWNQPDTDGRQRYTILLQVEEDLVRLKRAIVLKWTVKMNATRQALTLNNFSLGRLLLMPTIKSEKVYVIDDEAARYFFYTEQYYPVVRRTLTRDLEAFRNLLKDSMFRKYTDEPVMFGDEVEPILLR